MDWSGQKFYKMPVDSFSKNEGMGTTEGGDGTVKSVVTRRGLSARIELL